MAIGDITLTAVGNLTGDPELRFTPSGTAVAAFTVAVNPRTRDKDTGQWTDGEPSYVPCQAWRDLGEHVAESLTRGDRVIVAGRWREEHWEKDGEKRSRWTLTADSVGADLTWATVKVSKSARTQGVNGGAPPDDAWATASKTRPTQTAGASSAGSDDPPF